MFDSLDTYSVSLIAWLMLGAGICGWLLLDPRWLEQRREARRVSGLLTAAIGVTAALIVVFAPLHTRTTQEPDPSPEQPNATVETTSRVSLWDQGLPPEFSLMLAAFAGVMIVIGRCAVPHGREHSREALIFLWISALVLLIAVAITIMTVGLVLIPVATLALVTAVHATRARFWETSESDESDQEFEHKGI